MRLDKIILENFLTYDYLEYSFDNRPVLVQGLNLTDEGQKSNGSGKSGMQTGIEFCITASNSRDVRDSELVSFGFDKAKAQLFTSCDIRKETLHIDWDIKVKGSNKLSLKKKSYDSDEWQDVSFSNVNDGKKYILQWFDISKEDLFNYFIINKVRFKSFFKSSNREKVELINRFSDASIIEGIENVQITNLQSFYETAQREVAKIEGKIEVTEEKLEKEQSRDLKAEFENKVKELKEDNEDLDEEIEEVKLDIKGKEKLISKNKASIKQYNQELAFFNESKQEIELERKAFNIEVGEINKKLTIAQELVDNFIKTDWTLERKVFKDHIKTVEENIEEVEKKIEKSSNDETKILKVLSAIEVSLSGLITCPSCKHEFFLDDKKDPKTLRQNKSQVEGMHLSCTKLKQSLNNELETLKINLQEPEKSLSEINEKEEKENEKKSKLVDKVNSINQLVTSKNIELRKIDNRLTDKQQEIQDHEKSISLLETNSNTIRVQIKELESEITSFEKDKEANLLLIENGDIDSNKQQIKELKKELKQLESDKIDEEKNVQKLGDKIYKRNQWINNFKQFKMFLANQSLESIQYHCNRYLSGMQSDLRVRFDGFKILANGSIKDEITATVIRNGVERTFSSFSGGEMGRLLFASILANRYMINKTHKYGGLDFLSVDEVFEGVDSVGLRLLLEEAKQLQICIMLITHVTDEKLNEDTILMVKENGTTKIR